MIDRPEGGENAILVHIDFPDNHIQENLMELKELADSAGAHTVGVITGTRHAPHAKYFVGSGKAEEIKQAVQNSKAELAIFNHALSPAQERNLEKLLNCRVLDRTGLILDIFAQRARSFEGKLQVELALLKHMSTRLVRGWTHLERQKGGIGLRGPGETQLETDRRLIRRRIQFISERLAKVRSQREQSRRSRRKATVPTVALVGYTNAGKSTLFNVLCESSVYAADQLFATLDPTLRRISLPQFGHVILADTVGFIRHLPHDLVEAFRATLEEVAEADLLIHVVDLADPKVMDNIAEVQTVLKSIQADKVPQILAYNKIDLTEHANVHSVYDKDENLSRVWISAATGLGMNELKQALVQMLDQHIVEKELTLNPADGRIRARLFALDAVMEEKLEPNGDIRLKVRLPKIEFEKLFR